MTFDLSFERVYPQPAEQVWQALSDPAALGSWLMETDFVPEVGREFTMWCDGEEGTSEKIKCALLEYDPPRRMLWSWQHESAQQQAETFVE
ncbi:MAG: SRPBCC domain-containing protein, partial [Kiloniellales bacterium]|nr:SRPBCC domain-containing protein [Kiloniellales bacterium]